jgi:pimeloyl-ACP methyl ester carboxylesterase
METIDANGLRFAYLSEGKGPLMLMLHGFPDTPHTWDAARPELARAGFRVVAPYTRGYAPTGIPGDGKYDLETLGRDALALIQALGEERAIVVGHDWGAAAAFAAASLAPERIAQLVTVAVPHPASVRISPRLLWGARHFIAFQSRRAEERVAANDFAMIDELVRRWSPAWRPTSDETAAVKECFRQAGSLTAALGYYRAVGLRPPKFLLKKIAVPSVAFSGSDDGTLRLSDYERARRWYQAPHEIVQMPGGHFLHREHPKRFSEELLRVLQSARD